MITSEIIADFIHSNQLHQVIAALTLGREHIIPCIFCSILRWCLDGYPDIRKIKIYPLIFRPIIFFCVEYAKYLI